MYYDCTICLSVNHVSRLHCWYCGTTPAMYSMLKTPTRLIEHKLYTQFIPVVAANGVYRAVKHSTTRCNLRTMPLDYYAEA